MATGPVTLACALLLANAGAPDTFYMNQGQFQIPIKVAPERRAEIRELLLYVSRDKGQSWSVEARATPDKAGFPFYAAGDGHYWFKVAVLDQKGRQDPVDIYQAPDGQRIVVDTKKPEVRIPRAERRGDEVQVQWEVRDENPDLATFRLEYRTADHVGAMWVPLSVQPALQGETSFRPAGQGAVQVRVLMKDQADNVGQAVSEVTEAGTAAPPPPEPVGAGPRSLPPPPGSAEPGFQVTPPPVQPPQSLPPQSLPPSSGTPVGEFRPSPPVEPTTRLQPPYSDPPPQVQTQKPLAQSDPNRYPLQPTSGTYDRSGTAPVTPPYAAAGMRGTLPPVEIVNKQQAKINVKVGKYGPSGLGAVEVYVTTDDGATWSLSGDDRNVTLPPVSDGRGGTSVMGTVLVDLKQEGVVYGYYIVVKSKAGLGKKPPESGTPPQVRIEMDITPPSAELYKPVADPGRRDTLVLTWKATDKNLANNPVTLEWAAQKDGQWNVIGTPEMANTGQFSWQVPANVPPSVYLRLAARDTAGNVAVAQTQEPVLVDLSMPEVEEVKVTR